MSDLEMLIQFCQVEAIANQAGPVEEKYSNPLGWKSFDMRAVVSATEDLFQFILSDKGVRVRVFILKDIINAADTFLEDEVVASMFDINCQAKDASESEVGLNLLLYFNIPVCSCTDRNSYSEDYNERLQYVQYVHVLQYVQTETHLTLN